MEPSEGISGVSLSKTAPMRAIVKKLVRDDVVLNEKRLKKMHRDLKTMRRSGVYPMDVRLRNYRAGLFLDMSIAITKPHFSFEVRDTWYTASTQREDLQSFQKIISDSGIPTSLRAISNREYCKKVRRNTNGRKGSDRRLVD